VQTLIFLALGVFGLLPFPTRWETIDFEVFGVFRLLTGFKVFSVTNSLSKPVWGSRAFPGWWNLVSRLAKPMLLCSSLLIALAAPAQQDFATLSASISVQQLPAQGLETYRNIRKGGPFPFDKDGVVFGNRERLLPLQKRGFYREYTVRTPGERNRGPRRIVCGGPATVPEACYYTADHYASFRKIVP
jgi:ribonuclease T1